MRARAVSAFLRLAPSDRRLVVRCAALVAAMRLMLYVCSVRTLHAVAARRAAGRRRHDVRYSVARIAWGVRAAASRIPGASCLPQALAAHYVMTREGHAAQLRIGLAVGECDSIQGHAWVECEDAIVLGDGDLARYSPVSIT